MDPDDIEYGQRVGQGSEPAARRYLDLERRLRAVEAQRDKYREVLSRYGQHLYFCAYIDGGDCDCGYSEARAVLHDTETPT